MIEDDDLDALEARLQAVGQSSGGFDDNPIRDYPVSAGGMRRRPVAMPPGNAPTPPPASEVPRGQITDLRSWSSRYRFTPELEYLKIMRTQPALYRNVNATGWLCDVYNPIDENYLGTIWGGGVYIIIAFQNSGGGPREVSRGYVQINGNPRAFRGQDGQPAPFPADPNEDKYAGLPGVAQPQAAAAPPPPPQPIPFPNTAYPPPPPANSYQPTVDLISLAEKFSGTRQDSKSLEVLRDAQQANAEFYQQALTRSVDEQRTFREQLMAAQAGQTAPLQTALENYRAQMESRERSNVEAAKRMVDEHTAQLATMRAQHEKTLDVFRAQQEKTLDDLRRAGDAALVTQRDEARQREQTIRETARIETEGLRRELDRIREESRREIDSLRDQGRRELSEAREAGRREIDLIRSDAERRETASREVAVRDVATVRADADRREQHARDNANNMYAGQIRILEQQLAQMREQQDQRVSDVRSMLESQGVSAQNNFQLQLQQRESDLSRLRDELQSARVELAQLRGDLAVKTNPMSALTEVAQLTQTFQAITGTGPQPPVKEEEPKTILAQLAKYAPAIGEHLIKPTMKPIAEAVQTVREREEREEALRRDILMRRQAMQSVPAAAGQMLPQTAPAAQVQQVAPVQSVHEQAANQQRLLSQQRAAPPRPVTRQGRSTARPGQNPPGGRIAAPPAVVVDESMLDLTDAPETPDVAVLAAPPVVHAPAAPGAPTVVELPVSSDLLTYLKEALDAGTSPQSMADNLKLGVTLGMVPEALYLQLKELPTAAVVDAIQAAAIQSNIQALVTPRAVDFLEATHKAVAAA